MKKQAKKLVLAKETVKTLTSEKQLTNRVLGGVSGGYATCVIACFHSQQPSCVC